MASPSTSRVSEPKMVAEQTGVSRTRKLDGGEGSDGLLPAVLIAVSNDNETLPSFLTALQLASRSTSRAQLRC